MESDIVTVSREEKREIEKMLLIAHGSNQNVPVDVLSLILYKLSLLEEKIDRIEFQTRTHWVN
ncbi:MAG: hypothetical protein ACXWV6_08035 [Chitinophagaceae bacterium]